jgi:uncharacterized protein YxeA
MPKKSAGMNNKKVTLIILVLLVIIVVSGIVGSEYYTSRPEFCGSCHIMKNYYDSWKQSKHGDEEVACIECHYAPGEKGTLKVKFKGLGQLFSYLAETGKSVRKITKVPDESCMTSECHPREKFLDKKIQYTEKIPYVHKTHDDKTIEGQALHCDSCHQHVRPGKHFQVPEVSCYLCHFKNIGFNEGRGRCALCHKIPTKPLRRKTHHSSIP